MNTRSAKKHKYPLDEEEWACKYLSTDDKPKVDDAAFYVDRPTSMQDLDISTLHEICLKVCK
jgi:hypothetical protein